MTMPELRADPEALGRGIIQRFFELFNWNDPDEQMLRDWQQECSPLSPLAGCGESSRCASQHNQL